MASSTLRTFGVTNIDSLLATTKEVFAKAGPQLNDAIFTQNVLLDRLNKKSKVTKQGGASILSNILYGKNNTFKAYSGDEILNTTGTEGVTTAQFKWKNYGGTVKYDGDEVRMNSGQGKLLDLVNAKVEQAMMSAADALSQDLYASSQVANKVSCLPILVDATSDVGDINSTTYSWWQSQVTASGSFAARGLADLRDLRNDILRQGQSALGGPDLIVTTQAVSEYYEAGLEPQIRYRSRDRADASFSGLDFSGAEIVFDTNCPSGTLFMLPLSALEFVCHSDAQWTLGNFIEPANQDVRIAKILWMGNLITNNRRRLGKLTSITA